MLSVISPFLTVAMTVSSDISDPVILIMFLAAFRLRLESRTSSGVSLSIFNSLCRRFLFSTCSVIVSSSDALICYDEVRFEWIIPTLRTFHRRIKGFHIDAEVCAFLFHVGSLRLFQIFEHPHSYTLNLTVIDDDIVHVRILRVQSDAMLLRFRVKSFQRCVIIDQCDDDLTFVCIVLLADENEVSVLDACFDHRITVGAENEEISLAEQ